MTIQTAGGSVMTTGGQSAAASGDAQAFADAMEEATSAHSAPKKSKREMQAEQTRAQIDAFWADVKKAGGVMSYLIKYNLDKIDKLVKEKEQELRKASGVDDPSVTMSPQVRAQALQAIAKAVEDYREQLMKELREKEQAEKAAKAHKTGLAEILVS